MCTTLWISPDFASSKRIIVKLRYKRPVWLGVRHTLDIQAFLDTWFARIQSHRMRKKLDILAGSPANAGQSFYFLDSLRSLRVIWCHYRHWMLLYIPNSNRPSFSTFPNNGGLRRLISHMKLYPILSIFPTSALSASENLGFPHHLAPLLTSNSIVPVYIVLQSQTDVIHFKWDQNNYRSYSDTRTVRMTTLAWLAR